MPIRTLPYVTLTRGPRKQTVLVVPGRRLRLGDVQQLSQGPNGWRPFELGFIPMAVHLCRPPSGHRLQRQLSRWALSKPSCSPRQLPVGILFSPSDFSTPPAYRVPGAKEGNTEGLPGFLLLPFPPLPTRPCSPSWCMLRLALLISFHISMSQPGLPAWPAPG